MPKPYIFKTGVRYTVTQDDKSTVGYEILDILKQGNILVKNIAGQEEKSEVHSLETLRQFLWAGKLKFGLPGKANLREEAGVPLQTSYDFSVITDLPEEVQTIVFNRFGLIEPLLQLPSRERTDDFITQRTQELLDTLLEARKRGAITVLFGEHIGKGKGARKARTPPPSSEADKEEGHVDAADDGGNEAKGKSTLSSLSHPLPELPTITCRSVRRWVHSFEESNGDIRSLVPSYHRNGPQAIYTPPETCEVIREAIKKVFKKDKRAPITTVIDEVKRLIKKKNKDKTHKKQLHIPAARTVYRFIMHLDLQERWELGMDHTYTFRGRVFGEGRKGANCIF